MADPGLLDGVVALLRPTLLETWPEDLAAGGAGDGARRADDPHMPDPRTILRLVAAPTGTPLG